jgi:hypothetical protein
VVAGQARSKAARYTFVDGSLDWRWLLTGNPSVFSSVPVILWDAGQFTFNTFIVPGANGFDVGWLAKPQSETYSSIPDKTDASMSSPLSRLLAMTSGGFLKTPPLSAESFFSSVARLIRRLIVASPSDAAPHVAWR